MCSSKMFYKVDHILCKQKFRGLLVHSLKKKLKTCVKMCVADKNVWKYAYMCLSGCTNEALNMGKRFQGKYFILKQTGFELSSMRVKKHNLIPGP